MYSSIVLMILHLAFYNVPHHLDINLFDWFMLRHGNGLASRFSESVMAAPASWRFHSVPEFFENLPQFFKAQIIGQRQDPRQQFIP